MEKMAMCLTRGIYKPMSASKHQNLGETGKNLPYRLQRENFPGDPVTKLRPGAIAQSPSREPALAWASLAQRSPASSVLLGLGIQAWAQSTAWSSLLRGWFPYEGPRHLHRIPRLSEAPREVP